MKKYIVEIEDDNGFKLSGEFIASNKSKAIESAKDFYSEAQDVFPENITIKKVYLKP